MITNTDVEKAEAVERGAWELQHCAFMAHQTLLTLVHDTAAKRRAALQRETQLASREKPNAARLEYTRARSTALRARMHMQLQRSAKELADLRAKVLAFAVELDLGPLLDSCPE